MYTDKETGDVFGIVENKDRTGVYGRNEMLRSDSKLGRPSLLEWQSVIDNNKGKSNFAPTEDFNKTISKNEKAFEQIVNNQEVTSINKTSETESEETVDSLVAKIKSARSSIPPTKKPVVQASLKKEGFGKLEEITDIEVLKKYLKIVMSV
jgi:hypothetical protein